MNQNREILKSDINNVLFHFIINEQLSCDLRNSTPLKNIISAIRGDMKLVVVC